MCLIVCYALFSNVFAQELKSTNKEVYFYTEISPPYFWFDENGQPQGAAYDLALALMAHTNIQGVVEHLPWARAYVEATSKPDIILLTALRTQQREEQFQWLGTVHTAQAHLIALKSNSSIQLVDFEDSKKYIVGTIRGYGAAHFLTDNGFSEGKNLKLLSNQKQLWSMLFKGRIDLVLDNSTTGKYALLSAGFDSEDVKSLVQIEALNANLEMATGNLTNNTTAERLRIGLQQLKDNGVYQQIMNKWGLLE
jgi:polar amino acid transport system substrate-binding protein